MWGGPPGPRPTPSLATVSRVRAAPDQGVRSGRGRPPHRELPWRTSNSGHYWSYGNGNSNVVPAMGNRTRAASHFLIRWKLTTPFTLSPGGNVVNLNTIAFGPIGAPNG